MARFSERHGFSRVRTALQTDGMDEALRNGIWNCLDAFVWSNRSSNIYTENSEFLFDFVRQLWALHYKLPIDNIPNHTRTCLAEIRIRYFDAEWYEVYDLVEFAFPRVPHQERFASAINGTLEREMSGYRLVERRIVLITDEVEIEAIERAHDDSGVAVRTHLDRALDLLSDRESPDFRNSIKESISAVESLVQTATGNLKATLGDGLKALDESHGVHPALKQAFSKLYGYASDEGGIRHALQDDGNLIGFDEAKFMLVAASAFVNLVNAKIA